MVAPLSAVRYQWAKEKALMWWVSCSNTDEGEGKDEWMVAKVAEVEVESKLEYGNKPDKSKRNEIKACDGWFLLDMTVRSNSPAIVASIHSQIRLAFNSILRILHCHFAICF